MDIATELAADVSFWGGTARLFQLDAPLEGFGHVVVCDRTPLVTETITLPLLVLEHDDSTIDFPIEVFGTDDQGVPAGESLVPLRKLISLRRYNEGVDFAEVLSRLGYTIEES